ncbi:hypothetical protein GCM10010435_58400 [Winogradskya consettensis]|uniref:Uncharacterized protein n=1 Tax=Winogradskya consettensis TaxID=113560 RepID=A0A919S8X9_9ACTN|nr:DUF6082 family protein [Actinoplanes consettensis]GIM66904.1 hypothetical protein Aco04nite_03920 [Actinoplanes consettensis]
MNRPGAIVGRSLRAAMLRSATLVLIVLALGGVAVSLHMQRRESKAAREQSIRGLHTELLRMALDDETFLECWGPIGDSVDVAWYRQHIYLNLIVSHWQMMWEIGALTEAHLRLTAAGLFGGPLGRRYWGEARDARRTVEQGRRAQHFYSVVDDEYQAACRRLEQEIAVSHAEVSKPVNRTARASVHPRSSVLQNATWIGVGAAAGVMVSRVLGRRSVR